MTYQQDTAGWSDTNALEELRMSEWELNQLSDLCHLLSASSNIVVTNFVEVPFLVLPVERLAFAVDDCVLCNDAVIRGVELNNLELYLSHTTTHGKKITHPYRSVRLKEVWLEVDFEQRTGETFDGVGNGEDSNALGVLDIRAGVHCDDIATTPISFEP